MAIMSAKRRSDDVDRTSDSDIREDGLHQDIVSAVTPPFLSLFHTPHKMPWLKKMQAVESDLQEATAHARSMTPDEVEETINYILNEVISLSIAIADFSFTF